MFTFELICMLLEGYLNFFTFSGFLGDFKNIEIFGFLAHTQPAQAIFQRTLSLRRQFFNAGSACVGKLLAQAQCAYNYSLFRQFFFSAGSACVGNFLAPAQPAQAIFQRMLSMRRQFFSAHSACAKNTKWRISAVAFEKK